jgi:hypothetical protein
LCVVSSGLTGSSLARLCDGACAIFSVARLLLCCLLCLLRPLLR